MDFGIRNLSSRCKCCNKPFMSLLRGNKARVCDSCFRTTNGRIAELNEYCNDNPKAELFQISRALNIELSEVISLINYSDAMNKNPSMDTALSKVNAARKLYNDEMEQRRKFANKDNNSRLVDDLRRIRRN